MTRHGARAASSWPRVVPKTTHLLRKVACTRTRTTSFATLRSRTTAPLPATAIRGCAAAVDAAPPAVGMTVGGAYEINSYTRRGKSPEKKPWGNTATLDRRDPTL